MANFAIGSTRVRTTLVALAAAICLGFGLAASAPAYAYPDPIATTLDGGGDVPVSDPTIIVIPRKVDGQSANQWLLYGTTDNRAFTSPGGVNWTDAGIAGTPPAWWANYRNIWAPDVSYHPANHEYWMYYSVNSAAAGSAIGLAMSSTGEPGTWIDYGAPVLTSSAGYDAIDPHSFVAPDGTTWLTSGSFENGIYIVQVDSSTGLPIGTPVNIASTGEGSDLIYANGYYYLFFSDGYWCCYGTSNYHVRVGRSTSPTGPYVDESGTSLMNGGGTTILASHDYVNGPGGSNIFTSPTGQLMMAYHYWDTRTQGYDGQLGRVLGLNSVGFDANGWPYLY